jgi:hypothetical protein
MEPTKTKEEDEKEEIISASFFKWLIV